MKFKELIVLLPCDSLETLSLRREQAEAEELLAGWSGLYHPDLLARAESTPKWMRAEAPPEDPAGSLIAIPRCAEPSLPPDWLAKAETSGARLLRDFHNRSNLLAGALADLGDDLPRIEPALAADFLALGFCHFQVEVLTRQLRYMSNLDEERFRGHILDAVPSAQKGDAAAAREHLRGAFDRLTEAREYFYPTETYLLDLTLVAPTTLGESLRHELSSGRTLNLLISGSTVEEMARREPATLALLREGLEAGRLSLIGGEYEEQELPLLTPEGILDQLRRGLACYEKHLGQRPTVFGRRRFGLTPLLPQILRQLGFTGALHFTLDDGRFPVGNQSKLRWEGLDGTELESLARIPFEVVRAERYLRLSERLGDTSDLDHASAAVFAHWPGQSSPWYDDLWCMAQYGPALGRFTTLSQYFQGTTYSGRSERYTADKYRSPYLSQDVDAGKPDPISRWVRSYRQSEMAHREQALLTMTEAAGGKALQPATEETPSAARPSPELDPAKQLDRRLEEAMAGFAALVLGPRVTVSRPTGLLLANPRNFTWRESVDVSPWDALPAVSGPVVEAAEAADHKQILVDVPAMGFAWVGPDPGDLSAAEPKKHKKRGEKPAPLAEGNVLKNEHLEVTISPVTGGIQALHNHAVRVNRLGQQIAMRLARPGRSGEESDPGGEQDYSIMAADEVSVVEAGPLIGRIQSRGRLMDRQGQRVARFLQTAEIRHGSRILELRIDLETDREPDPEPWSSYYAVRFAWTDEAADTYRSVGWAARPTETAFLESPLFFDIRASRSRMTILSAGLPYHRRFGLRKLDTLLIVRGESARSFRLGIGMDLAYPAPAALGFLAGGLPRREEAPPGSNPSGWLFHVDVRGVVATHWEPVRADGKPAGFRVRLLETEGRQVQVGLRVFRSLASARRLDLLGQGPTDLPVQDDRTTLDLGPYQWAYVEALFAEGK